jgi:hypothetical protein
MRNAFWIAVGARSGLISRDAKNVSMTALMLIKPSPSVTGTMFLKTSFTAGSRQSITSRRCPS